MSPVGNQEPRQCPKPALDSLVRLVRARTECSQLIDRGIIDLNTNDFKKAAQALRAAWSVDRRNRLLPSMLAAAYVGMGLPVDGIHELELIVNSDVADVVSRIRLALLMHETGRRDDAVRVLREGLRNDTECAELHFQLGTMLASTGEYDEAELRFIQAANINPQHSGALLGLAMCYGARGCVAD